MIELHLLKVVVGVQKKSFLNLFVWRKITATIKHFYYLFIYPIYIYLYIGLVQNM